MEMEVDPVKLYRAQGRVREMRITDSIPRQIDELLLEYEREEERTNARASVRS